MDTTTLKKIMELQGDLYFKPYLDQNDAILIVLTKSFENAPVRSIFQGHNFEVVKIPDAVRPGQKYELGKEGWFWGKTQGWIISNISLSHSIGAEMIDRGMFLVSNPGITEDWLPLLEPANQQICQKHADSIMGAIGGDVGGEIHILADDGTDLRLKVPNGNWWKETGKREGVGTNGLFGEFATSPYNACGTYVLNPGDFLTNPINEVVEEIILTIRNNRIVEIRGGCQAETLKKMLTDVNDPLAFSLAEFAIGINPGKPKNLSRSVVAEKLLGGVHIATGTNSVCLKESCPDLPKFKHGRYNCGVHIDCIKFGASVHFRAKPTDNWIAILAKSKIMV